MDNALDDLVFRFESELTPATDSRLGDSLAALRAIADGVTDELDDGSSDAEPIDHKAAEPVEIRSTAELVEVAETAESAEVAETDETDEVAEVAEAAELAVTEPASSGHAVEPAEPVRPEEAGPPVEDRVPDHEDTSWSTARRQRRQLLAALPQSDGIASSPNSDETHFGDASQPSAAASEVVEPEVVQPEVIEPQTSASVRDESDYRESVPDTPAMIARTSAPVSDDDGDSGNVGEPRLDVAEPPSRSEPQRATILSRKIVRVDPQTGRRTEEYLTEQPPTPDRVRREGSRPGEPVRRAGRSETVVRQATPAPQVPLTEEVSPADQASASSAVADQSIRGHRDPVEPTTAAPLDKIDDAEPESRSNDHDIEDTDRNDRGLDDPRLEDPDLEDTLAEDPEDTEDREDLEAPEDAGQSDWGPEYGSAADSDIADSDNTDSDIAHSDNTDSDITDSDIAHSDIAHSDNTDSDITDSDIAHSNIAHSNIARSASDGRDLDRDLVEEYDLPAFLRGTIADGDQVDRHVEELENQPLVQSQPQSGSQAPLAGRPGPPPTPAPPTGRPTPPDDREIVHIGPEPAAPVKPFATRQSLENIGSSGWKEAIGNSSDKPANDPRPPVPEDDENDEDYEDYEDYEDDEDYGDSHELEHLDGEVADRDGDLFAPADLFDEVDPVNDDVSGFHAEPDSEPDSDADPDDDSIVDTDAHRTPPIQIPAQPAPNPQPTTPSAPAMGSDAGDGPPSPWRARIAASAGIALLMIGTVFLLTSFVGGDDETPDSDPTTIDTPVDAAGVDPAIDTTDTTAADLGSGNAPGATVTVQSSRLSAEALTCNRLDGLSAIVETTESTAIVISVMARFLDRDGNALFVHEPVTVVAAPAIRSVVTFPYDDDQVSGDDRFAEPTCELIVSEADG